MIKSFGDKEAERFWNKHTSRKIPGSIQQRTLNKLARLHAAEVLEDLRHPPSNHLETLKGKRKEQHSIRINQQWRICFKWNEGAENVTIEDYH